MVFSCEVSFGFSVENHTHIHNPQGRKMLGARFCFLETPQGGEKVFQALTSRPTGKI